MLRKSIISAFVSTMLYRPVGRTVMRLSLEREVWGSNLRPVKSNPVLPTARNPFNISSNEALLPTCAVTWVILRSA